MEKNCLDKCLQRLSWFFSIITGVFGIVFACYQIQINKELTRESKMKDQPVFQVHFNLWGVDTTNIYAHEDIIIENKGEKPRYINTPEVLTYLKFDYRRNDKEPIKTFYIPINGYFGYVLPTDSLTGRIAFTYTFAPNNAYFYKLHYESYELLQQQHVYALINMVHITKIDYTDKYNEQHITYFVNERNVDDKEAEDIINHSKQLFEYDIWHIEDLSLTKIKEICKINN